MFRVITSSNRVITSQVARATWNFTRTTGNDAEAGSVATGNDAFSKKEHAEEARWARRHDAEAMAKIKADKKGSPKDRLAALEAEKRRIEQEIDQLKRQKS